MFLITASVGRHWQPRRGSQYWGGNESPQDAYVLRLRTALGTHLVGHQREVAEPPITTPDRAVKHLRVKRPRVSKPTFAIYEMPQGTSARTFPLQPNSTNTRCKHRLQTYITNRYSNQHSNRYRAYQRFHWGLQHAVRRTPSARLLQLLVTNLCFKLFYQSVLPTDVNK